MEIGCQSDSNATLEQRIASLLRLPLSPTPSSSKTFILIRHGEKHDWTDGLPPTASTLSTYDDNHLLSAKGVERAAALVPYFTHRPEFKLLFSTHPLAAVYAQDVDTSPKGKGQSYRPKDTVLPLISSSIHHLPLHLFTKKRINEMISELKTNSTTASSVLISWSHHQLPFLAAQLGATASSIPPHFSSSRYDITWIVSPGQPLLQLPQLLLYGDQPTILPLQAS